MAQLLVTLVVIGLVMAVEPLPVIGFILVLSTPRGRPNGFAFLLGWVATMVAIAAGVVALDGTWDTGGGGSKQQLGYAIQLVAGLALLALWRVRRRRPAPSAAPAPPGWMRRIDRLNPAGAAALGFLLQPWPLTAAGMGAILHADVGVTESIVAAVVFVVVSAAGLLAMLGYEVLSPDAARRRLGALRSWLETHRSAAITFTAGVAGAWLAVTGAARAAQPVSQTTSEKPPSTTSTWPRTISASGEQRNATAPATSSGSTRRPAGFAAPASSISSRFGKCSSAPVSTTPAETALTRIPRGASSTAR